MRVGGDQEAYPGQAARGAAPGQQQLDDVQVVVVHGDVQGRQATLRGEGQGTAFTQGTSHWPCLWLQAAPRGDPYPLLLHRKSA